MDDNFYLHPARLEFLELFPKEYYPQIVQICLIAARTIHSKIENPKQKFHKLKGSSIVNTANLRSGFYAEEILVQIGSCLSQRVVYEPTPGLRALALAMIQHSDKCLAYARWCFEWDALPDDLCGRLQQQSKFKERKAWRTAPQLSLQVKTLFNDPRRQFLNYFPDQSRGFAAQSFMLRVKEGCERPPWIVKAVQDYLGQSFSDERPHLELLSSLLVRQREEALEFAAWCLEWLKLPEPEKQQWRHLMKYLSRKTHMQKTPPSDKQLTYLRVLGWRDELPENSFDASQLIQELKTPSA